jgi:CspA family cold shock protein
MATGTVKFFNARKGFGFILPERAGMHTLNEGQQLTFELESGRDGRTSAVNLQAG